MFFDGVQRPILSSDAVLQVVGEFEERSTSDRKELGKFTMTVPPKTLGDVSRHGACGITNLVAESEILCRGSVRSYFVHLSTKFITQLPNHQFLNTMCCHEISKSTSRTVPSVTPRVGARRPSAETKYPSPQDLGTKHRSTEAPKHRSTLSTLSTLST
jgi:hypothetical protein